jgi:hypothetical protein
MPVPEPITVIDGVPQYAQAIMADGSIIIASTPPEVGEPEPEADFLGMPHWPEPELEAEP